MGVAIIAVVVVLYDISSKKVQVFLLLFFPPPDLTLFSVVGYVVKSKQSETTSCHPTSHT